MTIIELANQALKIAKNYTTEEIEDEGDDYGDVNAVLESEIGNDHHSNWKVLRIVDNGDGALIFVEQTQ